MVKRGQVFDKFECGWDRREMKKLPLTLMIITLNEERNIERCIASAPFCSEVLVIDSQSQDQTCEIAQRLGARVLQRTWSGYGPQKYWGSLQARNDWVLSLDADETLSPELAFEMQNKFASLQTDFAYEMPRKSFHLGRWIEHGGWYPDYQLRLYNRKFNNWSQAQIHEKIQSQKIEKLQSPLLHFVFQDLSDQVRTNDRYSTLLSKKDVDGGKKFSIFPLLLKPMSKFLECYIWKLGILDGIAGLIIAVSAAYSIFLRWSKIWEAQMLERQKSPEIAKKERKIEN